MHTWSYLLIRLTTGTLLSGIPMIVICQGVVTDTGHPLQVSLLGRFHVGLPPILHKLLYSFHTRHGRTELRLIPREVTASSPFTYTHMPSKACETLYIQPCPIYYALLGSQGNIITLAHPDEPYMQKYGRFGEAPVPRSRT